MRVSFRLPKPFGLPTGFFLSVLIVFSAFAPFSPFTIPAEARLAAGIVNHRDDTASHPPLLLSQTGLYKSITAKPRVLTDSIYPYEVNTALWSDGAHKERFICVPWGKKVVPNDTVNYGYPDGTVLIKNFAIDTVVGDTTSRILIETRFLVVRYANTDSASFLGLSYHWRRNQTDADLVSIDLGEDYTHTVLAGGLPKLKRWHYPSRSDCSRCHKAFARGSLGFITPQLNRPLASNPSINQLQDLFAKGVLSANPVQGKPNAHRWRAIDDQTSTVEMRARSYLAANCSNCHGNSFMEWGSHSFEYFNPLQSAVYDIDNNNSGYIGKDRGDTLTPKFIYPGHPDSSFILRRLLSKGTLYEPNSYQMPPLATFQIDSTAVKLIRDWVCGLSTPPTPAASCKLLDIPYEPYEAPIVGVRNAMLPVPGMRAFLREGTLTLIYGHENTSAKVSLFDFKGRSIALTRIGLAEYRVNGALHPGLYLVKAGNRVIRLNSL